jgi:CHAT domain-containing protein
VAAVAALALLAPGCNSREDHDPLAPLVDAVGGVAPGEARLTGFDLPGRLTRNPDERNWRVLGAAARLRERVENTPAPDEVHALGIAHLLLGEWDEAIERLESFEADPSRAGERLSDLAAAYLERASALDQPGDYYRAVSHASRAIARNPRLEQAHFNHALALDRANFADEAREAWSSYLRLDSSSPWSLIARRHAKRLALPAEQERWETRSSTFERMILAGDLSWVETAVDEFPQQTRFFLQDELLSRWGAAARGSSPEATLLLDAAEALAVRLSQRSRDHLALDTVNAIRRETASDRRGELARAPLLYGRGREAYRNRQYDEAMRLFGESDRLLGAAHPFALQARFYASACRFNQNRYDDSASILDDLESRQSWSPERYRTLRASVSWIRGLVSMISGRPWESLADLEQALEIYTDIGETEHAASILTFLAENYHHLGESETGWKYRHRSLALLRERGSSAQLHPILRDAIRIALEEKNDEVASLMCERQLRAAVSDRDVARQADALTQCATVLGTLGDDQRATAHLQNARALLPGIADRRFRERTEADLALAEARLRSRGDARAALDFLDEAIEEYRRSEHLFLLTSLHLQRARLRVQLDEKEKAESDLHEALRLIESQREDVLDEGTRIVWLERFHETFEELISLLTDQGRWHEAFDVTERYRARSLLDRAVAAGTPATSLEIIDRMPGRTALLSYAVLSDRIVGWSVRSDGLHGTVLSASPESVGQLIGRLRSEIESGSSSFSTTARALHATVLVPLAGRLAENDTLVLVPDGRLHEIPFAALIDGRSGRHLIEDHALMIAPSGTAFVAARKEREEAVTSSVLVVGDPRFDPDLYPRLGRLRHAREESERIARLHPASTLVTGREASKRRLLEELAHSSILHFAGHAVADHSDPERSFLLLAPEGGDSGLAYAHELPADAFDRMSLVVLGACSTGRGRIWKSEGVGSLARAFLSRGVPAVVASVWDVEDESTSALLVGFHEHLRRGSGAVTALRNAQLERLATDEVRGWAGFQLYGMAGIP